MREGLIEDLAALRDVLVEVERRHRFDPSQPRDANGQWTDGPGGGSVAWAPTRRRGSGLPATVVDRRVRVPGGQVGVTADPRRPGHVTLTAGDRSVDIRQADLQRLDLLVGRHARYEGDTAHEPDGAYRITTPNGDSIVAVRPIASSGLLDEDGRPLPPGTDYDGEAYVAEYQMVVGDDGEAFDDQPSIRVRYADLDSNNRRGLVAALSDATEARRIPTADGPLDVFPEGNALGLRITGRDGEPVEVRFNRKDVRALDKAIDSVQDDEGRGQSSLTVETSHGSVVVAFDGETLTVAPSVGDWGMELAGADVAAFMGAFDAVAQAAGLVQRSAPRRLALLMLMRRFDPSQPRDGDGRWTDGPGGSGSGLPDLPGAQFTRTLALDGGAAATVERGPDRTARLTIGDRTVELSVVGPRSQSGNRLPSDVDRLRSAVVNAQYEAEEGQSVSDGNYRVFRRASVRSEGPLVSLRPVPGRYVTDDGRVITDLDDSDDADGNPHEAYIDQFDLVLNESADGEFGDEPSVRVSLGDLENIVDALEEAGEEPAAKRVDTGHGEVDVFSPGPGRIAMRVPTDDGFQEVEFDKADWKKVWKAVNDSLEQRESRTVDTANGRIEIQTDNPDDLLIGDNTMLFISSAGDPEWSIAAQGQGIKDLYMALLRNGRAAGIVRARRARIDDRPGGDMEAVRYSPEQPRVEAGSASGGQFATADSGGRKKSNGSETLGYDPKTGRGTGYGIAGGDARVKQLQEALNRLGLTDQSGAPLKVDGKLGPKTTAAIKKLQKQLGVKADGQVTPAFLKQITSMKGAKPAAKATPRPAAKAPPNAPAKPAPKKTAPAGPRNAGKMQFRGGLNVPSTFNRVFALDDIQIQRSGDGRTVEAYAAMFDAPYEVLDQHGHYLEQIDRSAFNRTLSGGRGAKALCLYNHGMSVTEVGKPDSLAQVPLGTPIEIRPDGRGLLTVTRYNRSALADAVLESIRNGDVRSQSFRGRIVRSSPNGRVPRARHGQPLPTVTRHELGLTDYGPTPTPVNEGAEIMAVRSVQDIVDELSELTFDEREELLRTLGLPTHDSDPGDEDEDDLDEDEGDTATSAQSEPGAEDPPAERSATHSGRLELKRAVLLRALEVRGVSRGKAA